MTTRQFWMKMDQVFDTKKLTPLEKEDRMAQILKIAYEENLPILGVFDEAEEGIAHQMYVNLDERNHLTVGNRYMLCYTGKNRAIYDTHAPLYPDTATILEVSTREMLNNVFNKRVIGGLIFNRYLDSALMVRKSVLEKYIEGDKPLPPNFVDTPMPYPLEYPHGMNPDMSDLSVEDMMNDPEMAELLNDPEMADMMKKVGEMFAANPEMAKEFMEMLTKGPDGGN